MPSDADRYTAAYLQTSVAAARAFADGSAFAAVMVDMAADITASIRAGGKLLVAGNGGSAADAQHLAGEFISRLMFDHPPLPAIALTVDSSAITATANDYGYEHVFDRQIIALGRKGDVFLGISTSGNSPNVVRALQTARAQGLTTHGFTGATDSRMTGLCDRIIQAPSTWTPIVQQIHITAIHIICALVERAMFPQLAPAAAA